MYLAHGHYDGWVAMRFIYQSALSCAEQPDYLPDYIALGGIIWAEGIDQSGVLKFKVIMTIPL